MAAASMLQIVWAGIKMELVPVTFTWCILFRFTHLLGYRLDLLPGINFWKEGIFDKTFLPNNPGVVIPS